MLFLVYLTMLLFAHVIYFLYPDEYLVNNEEETVWQYAVIPGLPKKKRDCFLRKNIFKLTPK
jgi:hypothetical protein